MEAGDFNELLGRDDALFRTLGVLVRHLHVKRIIDAPDLVREIRLVAGQSAPGHPARDASKAGMLEIAQSFENSQPGWSEERLIHDLYMADPGRGR